MSTYPIAYEQHPPGERSRLTVFFRFLMVIPHLVWALFYGLAFYVVEVIAWFAILFTGKWPQALYEFSAGYLRFITRVYTYSLLIVDEYPRSTAPSIPITDPDHDRSARCPVQPAEGLLPDHPRDPDLHPAVRHGDLAARRRRRALVRRGHHGQDPARG